MVWPPSLTYGFSRVLWQTVLAAFCDLWFVTAILGNTGCEATVLRDIGVQPWYFVTLVWTIVYTWCVPSSFVTRGVYRCLLWHVVYTVVIVTRGVTVVFCDTWCAIAVFCITRINCRFVTQGLWLPFLTHGLWQSFCDIVFFLSLTTDLFVSGQFRTW